MRMQKLLAAMALGACLLSGSAWAQSATDARLEALEKRIQQLEERLAERDAAMMEKEQALAKLKAKVAVQEQTAADIRAQAEEAAADGGIGIGGVIEVEIVHDSPYVDKSTSSADTATVDVAFAAELGDAANAELALTMDDDGKMEVDVAAVTIGMDEAPVSFTAGQILLPFADFGTELISDPMALELGEAHQTVLQIGFEAGSLAGSIYAFNGDADYKGSDRIGDFGVQADYGIELGGMGFNAGVGWLSDLRESHIAEEYQLEDEDWPGDRKKVAGLAVSAGLGFGPLTFSGHYITARDKIEELDYAGEPAQPSAYGVEAAYAFEMGDREVAVAAGWQRTREAVGLGMPETKVLFGFSTELVENVGIALEYASSSDYGATNGGTGKDGRTVTLQLAAEF